MENRTDRTEQRQGKGIRLNRMNVVFILIGVVIALFLFFSMYQTGSSFNQIVSVTEAYLSSQQTTGMLNNIADGMAEQCAAFIRTGAPEAAHAYAGQLNAINSQIASNEAFNPASENEDEFLLKALDSFRAATEMEVRAMRLMADTLPIAPEALPPLLQQAQLSSEDRVLPTAEKKALARSLINSDQYHALNRAIANAVDDSHRVASEKGKNRAMQTAEHVRRIMRRQTVLVVLFVVIALVALMLNRVLIINPIKRSVHRLDRRLPLPVQGCYEVRHLANVYNEVLKENAEKTNALAYTAAHDALTGVFNRADFDRVFRLRENDRIGLIVADVDHFKQYNDEFGHETGDQVLKAVAEKLKQHFRTEDHISRVGGDEFCIIMPGTKQEQAGSIAEKIRQINRELQKDQDGLPPITISAGLAFWDRPDSSGSIFRDADTMLLKLKKSRDDCVSIYPG